MRLISQDGMIDAPYENLTIAVDNDNDDGKVHILARGIVEYLSIIIAVYSNTDKALKVMEMLREQYMKLGMIKILASGTCEYMDKSLGKEEKMKIYEDYCRKHCFKFPDDSEVEV